MFLRVFFLFLGIWHQSSGEVGYSVRLLPPSGPEDPARPAEDTRGRVCQQTTSSVSLKKSLKRTFNLLRRCIKGHILYPLYTIHSVLYMVLLDNNTRWGKERLRESTC